MRSKDVSIASKAGVSLYYDVLDRTGREPDTSYRDKLYAVCKAFTFFLAATGEQEKFLTSVALANAAEKYQYGE